MNLTQDLDIWFERADDERIRQAAADAGGFWISGFGQQPPAFGGDGLQRVDVVLTAHGLDSFAVEYARALHREVDGVASRAADEAVEDLLVRHDVHRGVVVVVEWTDAGELPSLGLE